MTIVDPVPSFRATLAARRAGYLGELESLCAVECGSEMVVGVERVATMVGERLRQLGFTITRYPGGGFADHLVATTGVGGPQIVLGGHLDTTYTDYDPLPAFHLEDDDAVGPGSADMKGGIVVFLAALDCLAGAGRLTGLPITVVLNTDEERGAPTSREIFQRLAGRAKVALFSECAGPAHEIVVARRAKLSFRFDVKGVSKHAGGTESQKVSALVELAHKIIALEGLNARFAGATLNVGRAWGGIAGNTVPGEATALVDIRFPTARMEDDIRAAIEAIRAREYVPGSRSEVVITSFRPAWGQSEAGRELFELARAVAQDLGLSVAPESRGGTADSNWFGAAGVPCLDGLGPIGFHDHTPEERCSVSSLFDRALLVASLVTKLEQWSVP